MEKRRRTEALCSAPVKRKAKRVLAVILAVLMLHSVVGYDGDITAYAQTGQTTYDIAMGALTINNSNLSNYNNTVITGSSGSNMITIDGVSVNLTLSNLNLNIESDTATTAGWNSAIKLTNGASLNLTVTGDNTVSAGMQHAAINVPAGCSLVITKESTGTLTATAGSGAAGIGADYGGIDFQTVGNITINGGTVKAYGMGAGAGIGGTAFGNTGNIMIHGGTVYAKGGGGVEINYGQLSAVCGAGIGGGDAGCVQNINITGGNVTAVGGHQHISVANFMDRPGAGIGCGSSTYASADGKYTCGTIAITGGVISATGGNNNAVNAIGYGLSPNVDTSGDNFIGCVTISENASVDINGGTIHPLTNSDKVNVYKLGMTIYDGRLTKTLEGASIKVNGKTYHSDIKVSENYVGNISYSFVRGIFTGEQTIEISAGDFSWNTTINFTNNKFDYTTVIGSKLYPVSLKFYDLNLTADKTDVSLMVKKDGKALNTNPSDGMIQLVCDGKISFMEEAVGKMTAYMPAGASTDITISGSGLNNSADITLKAQTVSESSSGTVLTAWENAKKYNLKFTIYDGKLTKGSYPATIAIGEKTVTKEITVNQNYIGTAALSQYLPLGSDTKDVQITTSSYTWKTTITPSGNGGDTAVVFGRKLYPVSLWFYDTAITSDINNVSLSVTQDGKTLNTVETEGMVQLVSDGTIIKQRDGIGKMTAYMPAGAETLLTAIAHGINGGKEITVSYKTIKASDNGTILVLWDKVQTVQLSEILDLSNGSITFADNGGKMDITYTPVNGGTAKTVTGQYYQNEYNIIQSDNTVTANQIIFQNTTDFVNINLNAVNMKSTGKAIDLQNAKAKLNLIGTNIIDCGGGGVDSGDASNYIGIRAAKGSELTIDGNGSLEVKNPSYYGVGIGGYYHYTNKIYEGAGIIRIQGGTLKVSGKKNGAAIGSCYQYTGADFGSIYISGGVVDAISVSGAVIGGSADAKPANVYITGGTVLANSKGYGACIGSGINGKTGGKVVISGGYVEATATSSSKSTAIGGGYNGYCPEITISGGTIKATGSVASIGTANSGYGGSIKITGGTICTTNNAKPTINLAPTNDGTTPVYYTTADVSAIYGKNAVVSNATVTDCDYGFQDVKTDANGILHLYLPVSQENGKTNAVFDHVNYEGTVTAGDGNVLKKPIPLAAEADTVTSTGATLKVTSKVGATVYYVRSTTKLTTGSEVETADGVKSMTLSDGIGSAALSELTAGTENTCYLVAKIGSDYSDVVSVTFTTKEGITTYSVTAFAKTVAGETVNAFISGVEDYTSGTNATVTASAVSGYNFVGWYQASSEAPGYTGDSISKNRGYSFTVNGNTELVAVYKPLETVTITVDGGTSYTINGTEYTTSNTAAYPLGTMLTIAVSDATEFAYWTNNYGMVLSRNASYTFSVTGAMTLTAVYNTKVENQSTIIFESYYGQVMQRMQLGVDDVLTLPDGPTRFGYTFAGWSMTEVQIKEQIAAGTKVIRVTPVYTLIEQNAMITVIGGTGSGDYKQNDVVTVVADPPVEGMKFSHWTNELGNILSYNTTYTFYATGEAMITANYVKETSVVEAKGTAEIVAVNKDTANSKISFVSMVTVPTGCSIQIAGVIGTNVETVGTAGEGFNKTTALYVRGGAWSGSACRYTWTKKVVVGETWYVRAYLVYLDKNGNVVTVYGNMVSVSVTNG